MPEIESYHFGEIVIDGETYSSDVIVFPERVMDNWWRERGHSLSVEDLEAVLVESPQVLVIGKGAYSRMDIPTETRKHLEAVGIEVIAQPTREACQTYNRLRDEQRVIAALHLTC